MFCLSYLLFHWLKSITIIERFQRNIVTIGKGIETLFIQKALHDLILKTIKFVFILNHFLFFCVSKHFFPVLISLLLSKSFQICIWILALLRDSTKCSFFICYCGSLSFCYFLSFLLFFSCIFIIIFCISFAKSLLSTFNVFRLPILKTLELCDLVLFLHLLL